MAAKTTTISDRLITYTPPEKHWLRPDLMRPAQISWGSTSNPTPDTAIEFAKLLLKAARKAKRINAKLAAAGKLAEG